jgi:hypothetical protein
VSIQLAWPLAVIAAVVAVPSTSRRPAPDANVIVDRWTAALRQELAAAPQYSYTERIRDDDGEKTYEVTLLYGSPYKRLVEVNGQPLDASEQRKQQERFVDEQAERGSESQDDRAQRIAKFRKDFDRAHRILEELPRAFQFSLRRTIDERSGSQYVLEASPRPGYDPPTTEAEVLTGMRGEFWIDTATYQLSRAVARVLHPVTIEGFVATIQPGTEFEVEQQPVGDGVWLPTHFQIRSHSSILFFFHHHLDEDRRFFDYHREATTIALPRTTAVSGQ